MAILLDIYVVSPGICPLAADYDDPLFLRRLAFFRHQRADFVPIASIDSQRICLYPQLFIVGNYWLIHHRTFRQIIKYTSLLLWLNLILLLFVVFLPVPTAFLGRYGENSIITALHAFTQMMISLMYLIMSCYATSHHRLIAPLVDRKTITYGLLRSLIAVSMFALSIVVAFLNPDLAKLLWLAIFPVQALFRREYKRQEL